MLQVLRLNSLEHNLYYVLIAHEVNRYRVNVNIISRSQFKMFIYSGISGTELRVRMRT